MYCKNCNNKLEPGDLFCGECGTPVEKTTEKVAPRVNVVTDNENQKSAVIDTPQAESTTQHTTQQPNTNPQTAQQQTTNVQTQPLINKEQVNQQSRELVNEGKGFFSSAFKNHDQELKSNHNFSLKLSAALIGIGLLIVLLLLMIKIPSEIEYIGVTKSSFIFKIILSALAFIALIAGATFAIAKLLINPVLNFTKVLSDFVLINVFSFIAIIVGLLLIVIDSLTFGGGLTAFGIFLLALSPIYLIGKYSGHTQPKVASFYGVILYLILLAIVLRVFGESSISMLQGIFTNSVNNAMNGLFNNY